MLIILALPLIKWAVSYRTFMILYLFHIHETNKYIVEKHIILCLSLHWLYNISYSPFKGSLCGSF